MIYLPGIFFNNNNHQKLIIIIRDYERNENKSFQDTITKMKNIVVETKDRHVCFVCVNGKEREDRRVLIMQKIHPHYKNMQNKNPFFAMKSNNI